MDIKIVKFAAYVIVGSIVVPMVLGAVGGAAQLAGNAISKAKHNHKIKKGLKDGSIIEINGDYYEVTVEEA